MTTVEALTLVITVVVVPLLVWWLGRTGWTGDRKRIVVVVVSAAVGIVYAIVTGLVVVPDAWLAAIGKGLLIVAGWITGSQAVYQLIKSKLPDTTEAKRALTE